MAPQIISQTSFLPSLTSNPISNTSLESTQASGSQQNKKSSEAATSPKKRKMAPLYFASPAYSEQGRAVQVKKQHS